MSQQFTYVGEATKTTRERIEWTLEAQAAVLKAKLIDGKSTDEAFEIGRQILGVEELPQSYTNHNRHSLLDSLKKRFLKRCNKGDKATINAAMEVGLIQPAPTTDDE